MDCVSDALFDSRRLLALTVVDAFTREALAIDVDQGIKGEQVIEVMTPAVPPGPSVWTMGRSSSPRRSTAGLQPTDNAFVEGFHGRLREECLNSHWFLSLADARAKVETWRRDYNESHPHTSLGWPTPV